MEFYNNLYISESLEHKKRSLIRQIKHKKACPGIFIIALPHTEHNQLECYSASMLKQKVYDTDDLFIVGIANGYFEALYIIKDMYEDFLLDHEDVNIRRYIESQRQKGGV